MNAITEVVARLRDDSHRLALICGAGISVESGIPVVDALLEQILTSLGVDPIDIERLRHPNGRWLMPFEGFMDAFLEHDQKNDKLFDLFALGAPNRNHALIRQWALKGRLEEVCTTNFDLLIEKALEQEPAVAYTLVTEAGEVGALDAFRIVKLHGTVSDRATIRSTIISIAAGQGFEARKRLIEDFMRSEATLLLVWGYSCSDAFDITPIIAQVSPKSKTVVLIQHDPSVARLADATIQPLPASDGADPFRDYDGCVVRVDADVLMDALRGDEPRVTSRPAEDELPWREVVASWGEGFSVPRIRDSILCHLFYKTGQFDMALKYNARALELNDVADLRGRGAALSNRGMILYKTSDYDGALSVFREALEVFESVGYKFGIATSHNNLGCAIGRLGRPDDALRQLALGRRLIEANSFPEALLCRGFIAKSEGELHAASGEVARAERCYEEALQCFSDGHIAEQSEVHLLTGRLYYAAAMHDEAEQSLAEALRLASSVGALEVTAEVTPLLELLCGQRKDNGGGNYGV